MNARELALARSDAERFVAFCDGAEAAALATFGETAEAVGALDQPRRGRVIARHLIRACDAIEAERSAREAMQAARDRAIDLMCRRALESQSRPR